MKCFFQREREGLKEKEKKEGGRLKEKEKEEEGLKKKERKERKGKERKGGLKVKRRKLRKRGGFSLTSGFPKCYRVMHSLDNKIKMRYLSI